MKHKLTSALLLVALAAVIALPVLAAQVITIQVEPDVKVYVDDVPIDVGDTHGNPEAFIYNGTTYIAAKAVSNSLGENVKWDGKTRSVYIGKHDGSSYSLLDVCPPYETEDYRTHATVTMAAQRYANAFSGGCSGWALFNLNGNYDTLSFDIGHMDGTKREYGELIIYLDGELVFSLDLDPERMPEHYTIPLDGALQMKIVLDSGYLGHYYAMANIKVS